MESEKRGEGRPFDVAKSFKFDAGKIQYSLISHFFLEKVAELMTKGAAKYVRNNWRISGFKYSRAEDALFRHFQAWRGGEDFDEETGCHHMAAVAFYAMCIIDYHFSGLTERQDLDDRFRHPINGTKVNEGIESDQDDYQKTCHKTCGDRKIGG